MPVWSIAPTSPASVASAGEWPSTETLPASGSARPSSMSIVVDLPAPFGPSSATISPRRMEMSTPRTASTMPFGVLKDFSRPRSSMPGAVPFMFVMSCMMDTRPAAG